MLFCIKFFFHFYDFFSITYIQIFFLSVTLFCSFLYMLVIPVCILSHYLIFTQIQLQHFQSAYIMHGLKMRAVLCLVAQLCPTLCARGLQPAKLLCPWDSPGRNPGVDCHALLQGIFLTQGLNPGFPHCRQIFYCLSHSDFIYFKLNQMIKCVFIFNFLAAPCSTGILVSNQGSNLCC